MSNAAIGIIGLGHVGLVTALGFAEIGKRVIGLDHDTSKVARIQGGEPPFFEPGLSDLLRRHLHSGAFMPTTSLDEVVGTSSLLFLCVGTPIDNRGEPDLSQLESATRLIAERRTGYMLVVEKSTCPVTTAQWIGRTLERYGPAKGDFDIACNPEFLREGSAIRDFLKPDRIVLGVESERARNTLLELYEPMKCPKLVTDLNTAELIKHAANAFLSTKISFINMIADVCDQTGADIGAVADGIGHDPRIRRDYLHAGIGFGGYCLPKDLRAFAHIGRMHGVNVGLLEAVEQVNMQRIERFIERLVARMWLLRSKTVGVLGLAFKPGTDDVRGAQSLEVVRRLLSEGAFVKAFDPEANDNARALLPEQAGSLKYVASPYEAAEGADALAVLTEWPAFKALDLSRLRACMRVPLLADGRNLYEPATVRAAGFEYFSIGRR